MSTYSILGILGGICSLCGYIPLARQIIEGKEHPERATWLIWTLSNALILLSYFVLGARTTVWVPLAYLLGSALVTGLSFKYGKYGWGLLEKVALLVALITSIRWAFFDRPFLALVLNIALGIPGYVRVLWKLGKDKTVQEDIFGWSFYFAGAVLNLAAVTEWTAVIAILPVALFIMNGTVLAFALRNWFYRPAKQTEIA